MTAHRALAAQEPVFRRLLAVYGPQDPFVWHDGGRTGDSYFAAMVVHILGQRVSMVVAFTVYDRIVAALGGLPTPVGLIALGAQRLHELGLSATKADYLLDLAARQLDGRLDVEHLDRLSDGEVVVALTAVRGVGRWTAEMFLMRQLKRPDVLPADDLGVRTAVQLAWPTPELPRPGAVRRRAVDWSPYRSVAAALLWRSLKPAGEISDPKERALYRLSHREKT
jgi:DNA-3-methyladenine glycosylase II